MLLGILSLQVLAFAYHALSTAKGSRSNEHGTRKVWRPDSTLPFVENTLDLVRHVPDFQDWIFSICKQLKGEPFLIKAFGRPDLTVLYTPQAFEDVFKHQFACFPKGPFFIDNLKDLLGEGIFAVDDAKWVHQRKTASHLFTMRSLRDSMTATVQTHAKVLHTILQRAVDSNTPVDLFKLFNRFTIEAFAGIGFGIHLGCLDAEEEHPFQTAFDSAQREVILRFIRPGWFWKTQRWLGIGAEGMLKNNLKMIDDTVLDIVAKSLERRQASRGLAKDETGKDIVSLFLDNVSQNPDFEANEFDPKYLRDIVMNFLIAGRDTTAQALSWCFYNLSSHPEVVTKIRAEIVAKLPELASGKIATPTMEQVQDLAYLEAALRETLRLYPSVPFETKHVAHDIVLSDGTFIRGDTTVGLPLYGMGRMTSVWGSDAEVFNPDRWIDAQTGKIVNVSAYRFVAFSAGPRMCLGMNLAMLEMKLVVSGILAKFDVELLPGQEITYDFSLTLPVRGAMMASARRAQ
uniref:Cytochrome P450 n=1 Tax=Globisporangium ultimum (strain ATCC 200006 / CBS 805.95 / DAOM BR144) TaxID=431595 RepID=K3WMQ8_GLOUD